MAKIDWPKLLGSFAITLATSWLGSLLTRPNIETWYVNIQKTSLTPPNQIFAPVWITLFVLMAIALYIIWSGRGKARTRRQAKLLFIAQLMANIAWSAIFFNLHRIGWSLVEIIFLDIMVTYCLLTFHKINRLAGWLMLPYLIWICFATVLNFSLWLAN